MAFINLSGCMDFQRENTITRSGDCHPKVSLSFLRMSQCNALVSLAKNKRVMRKTVESERTEEDKVFTIISTL